jgi:DNA-binding NarL/FixJ family response regulator
MINVLIIDDHVAMREGLEAVLRRAEDVRAVGSGSDGAALWHLVKRARPDVVLLDYHLPGDDGLLLCHRMKNAPVPPAVVIYSAYTGAELALGAMAAGADGILGKSASADELLAAIRAAARGERMLPRLAPESVAAAGAKLEIDDRPLLGLLLHGATVGDVAQVLAVPLDEAAGRVQAVIAKLGVTVPESAA